MLLRTFARSCVALPHCVDEETALFVARNVVEQYTAPLPKQIYCDPRGKWDPGVPELAVALNKGDTPKVRTIVAFALLYELHVNKQETTSIQAAIETTKRVLEERDFREEKFSVLNSPWALKLISKQGRHLSVASISPEPPGPFYFHRAFEDVYKFLRQCADNFCTTAIEWTAAPRVYEDAYDTPLDFFLRQRDVYPGASFVSIRSASGWQPPHFKVFQPLITLPPKSEAGIVYREIRRGCICVARLKQTNCVDKIDRGITFGCLLGKGTQLDKDALGLLKENPYYQRSLGNSLANSPTAKDASAIVALFTGIAKVPETN